MTERERITLTGAQETMLATLYGRALESRSANPILGDTEAEKAVQRLDYDFSRTKIRRSAGKSVATRAKALDRWVGRLLVERPDSTVLHLACGLDTRARRVDPPSTARWYDIDLPDVIDLRRRVLPADDGAGERTIASSVTDPGLLDGIPGDAPVIAVAEGLTMYLSTADGEALLRRIVEHFPSGAVLFDVLSPLGVRLTRHQGIVRSSGARLEWGVDDPRELERAVAGLRLDTEWTYFDAPELDRYSPVTRRLLRLAGRSKSLRNLGRILCYRFGDDEDRRSAS